MHCWDESGTWVIAELDSPASVKTLVDLGMVYRTSSPPKLVIFREIRKQVNLQWAITILKVPSTKESITVEAVNQKFPPAEGSINPFISIENEDADRGKMSATS